MTTQFVWRKTKKLIALMEWSGIKLKSDLPYEYVYGDGPKFWYVPPTMLGYTPYGDLIHIDTDAVQDAGIPSSLHVGTVIIHRDHEMLKKYLTLAGVRLSRIKEEVEISSRVVDAV